MSAITAEQRARLRETCRNQVSMGWPFQTLSPETVLALLDALDEAERRLAAMERVAVRDNPRTLGELREWVDAELAKEADDGE